LLTFLGPSGCGKTTTLRTIAGLEEPTEGQITLGDETVSGDGAFVPPEQRDVGIVFQNFALFPHLTVRENIAFGLGDGADATADRVDEMLDLVDLPEHGEKTPDQLSGGQKQRVALSRGRSRRSPTCSSSTSRSRTSTCGSASRCARKSARS